MAWSEDDYLRLGERLRAARRELGYKSLKQFLDWLDDPANDAEVSGRTYADIEGGKLRKRRTFAPESLAYLEDLFGWAPGVTRAILDGKKVDLYTGFEIVEGTGWANVGTSTAFRDEDQDARYWAAADERLISLEERVEALERRLRPRAPLLQAVSDPDEKVEEREAAATEALEEPGEFH